MLLKRISACLVAVLSVFAGLSVVVHAQTSPGSGLQISPVRKELTIEPGSSEKISFTLRDIIKTDVRAVAYIEDFEPDVSGSEKLLSDGQHNAASIYKFVGTIPTVQLKSGESQTVTATVSVPKGTAAGAYYGIIRFQADPVGDVAKGNVALTANVGAVVLLTVPGKVTEKMQLIGTTALRSGKPSNIFANAPDQVRVEIKNAGTGFLKPYGSVRITDMFGKEVYTYQLNSVEPRSNIIPNNSRYFIDGIKGVSKPGRYKITTSLSYGSGGDVISAQTTFWLLPVWLAAVLAAIVAMIVIAVLMVKRRLSQTVRHHAR